jgi:homoserine kinase
MNKASGYLCAIISAIKYIVAFKAAPFDRYRTLDIMRAEAWSSCGAQIAMYTGHDDNIVAAMLYSLPGGFPDPLDNPILDCR